MKPPSFIYAASRAEKPRKLAKFASSSETWAKSEKYRLTESVVPSALREFFLTDHHRLDPTATFHLGGGQSLVQTIPSHPSGRTFIPVLALLEREVVPALRKLQILSVGSPSWARPVPKKNLVIKLRRIRDQSSRGLGRFDSLGNHLAFHVRARVPHLGLCICNKPCHP